MCTKKIAQWINESLALDMQPMAEEFMVNPSRFSWYKEQRIQKEVYMKYEHLNYYIPPFQGKLYFLIYFPLLLCRIL